MRFTTGVSQPMARGVFRENPLAIVVAGAEVRVPIEQIFDVGPGDLIVQRCMGSIAGRMGGTLFNSIEYAIARFCPKLLVVCVESGSSIVQESLKQVAGSEVPSPGMR